MATSSIVFIGIPDDVSDNSTSHTTINCITSTGWQTYMYLISRNFHQEKIFAKFATCSHWQKLNFYHANFLSCVKERIEDNMVTLTTLVKYFSTNFCNTKVAGLGETFIQWNFSRIQYYNIIATAHLNKLQYLNLQSK